MTGRTTYSAKPDAADAINRLREDGESFSEFILRMAAIVDEGDDGMPVTEPSRPADALTTEEFKEYMEDFARSIPEQTAEEIDERFG